MENNSSPYDMVMWTFTEGRSDDLRNLEEEEQRSRELQQSLEASAPKRPPKPSRSECEEQLCIADYEASSDPHSVRNTRSRYPNGQSRWKLPHPGKQVIIMTAREPSTRRTTTQLVRGSSKSS